MSVRFVPRSGTNLTQLDKLDLCQYNIYVSDIRQALGILSTDGVLKLLSPYKDKLEIKIAENLIIFNFKKKAYLLVNIKYRFL